MPKYDEKFQAEEQRSYVLALIRKQLAVAAIDAEDEEALAAITDESVAARADALEPEVLAELHDAGRAGQVDRCREILGLA